MIMAHDEKFFAWLDGELSGEEADAMAAKVAADPQLAELAEQHLALAGRLKSAFDPVAEAAVPQRLSEALRGSRHQVIDFAAESRERRKPGGLPVPQWLAIAATLVLGIGIGTLVNRPSASPVELQGGRVYAAAALGRALDTELASAPVNQDVRVGLTFKDAAGSVCRTFSGSAASGLACRKDDRWQLRGLFAAPEGQGETFRMAAGMDPNLAALVDSTMAGEPFDAAQEKAARDRGWR
jgi:anti-sigma factor RsiW